MRLWWQTNKWLQGNFIYFQLFLISFIVANYNRIMVKKAIVNAICYYVCYVKFGVNLLHIINRNYTSPLFPSLRNKQSLPMTKGELHPKKIFFLCLVIYVQCHLLWTVKNLIKQLMHFVNSFHIYIIILLNFYNLNK